jgi:tetratricopeptide (TPR) repeat protein
VYRYKGDYEKALDNYDRSLAIAEEVGQKSRMGNTLMNIGSVHYSKRDYNKMFSHLQKAANILKEIETPILEVVILFALANKNLNKEYDKDEILKLIKKNEYSDDYLNYLLYQLLEDKSYLKTAYKQVQDKASALEDELAAKFLNYPIPKAIVEEWEKVR